LADRALQLGGFAEPEPLTRPNIKKATAAAAAMAAAFRIVSGCERPTSESLIGHWPRILSETTA
jgi:hypothetical protein